VINCSIGTRITTRRSSSFNRYEDHDEEEQFVSVIREIGRHGDAGTRRHQDTERSTPQSGLVVTQRRLDLPCSDSTLLLALTMAVPL
jgi:hypothetical protein